MKKCESCNISFNIKSNKCPLCQNRLTGQCEELYFPNNVWFETNTLILKILLFFSLTIYLIFAFIEYQISKKLDITFYVGLGLLTNYVVLYFLLKNYKNIIKKFGRYAFVINLLLLLWFLATRSTVITNYIIPGVCLFTLLFNIVISIILRRNYLVKYSSQILVNIGLLFLPLLLVVLKWTTNNILAYICSLISVISLLALGIFFFDDIKEELLKRFNI